MTVCISELFDHLLNNLLKNRSNQERDTEFRVDNSIGLLLFLQYSSRIQVISGVIDSFTQTICSKTLIHLGTKLYLCMFLASFGGARVGTVTGHIVSKR